MRTRTTTNDAAKKFEPSEHSDASRPAQLGVPYGSLAVALLCLAVTAYLAVRLGNQTLAAADQTRFKEQERRLAQMDERMALLEELRTSLEGAMNAQRTLSAIDKELGENQQVVADLEAALDAAVTATKTAKGKPAVAKAKAEFNRLRAEAAKKFEEIGERAETLGKVSETARATILEKFASVKFVGPPAGKAVASGTEPEAASAPAKEKSLAKEAAKDGGKSVQE